MLFFARHYTGIHKERQLLDLEIRRAMGRRQEVEFFSLLHESRHGGERGCDRSALMAKLRVEAKYGALHCCCLTIRFSHLLEVSL